MPWTAKGAKTKGTPHKKKVWAKRANSILEDAVRSGMSHKAAAGKAVRLANWLARRS
jgi:hypothetical protein